MVQRDENGRIVAGSVLNPKGRPPKGEALTDILREKVDREVVADKLIALALDGDLAALKYIYDRIDGKPTEKREIDMHADIVRDSEFEIVTADEVSG